MTEKIRIMGENPSTSSKAPENPISVTDFLKNDSPLMQMFEKIPFLAPLKDIIGGLKNFLEGIGVKLNNLQSEVTQSNIGETISKAPETILGAIIPSATASTIPISFSNPNKAPQHHNSIKTGIEGKGGKRGQEISDADAKKWIEEMKKIKKDKAYQTAISFFVEKGLTPAQSVGIVANLHHESGLRANAVGDGGKAKGIAQWHPDRRAKIEKATGINVANAPLEKQLEALWWEITKGDEKATYDAIKKAKTEEEAARQFCLLFERPANKNKRANERAAAANKMMANIESGTHIV